MLATLSIILMLAAAVVYLREGLFTGFVMLVNVTLAGLVAFNFFEPVADLLDPLLADNFLAGCEDALCLAVFFLLTLTGLRLATNALAPTVIEFPQAVQRGGGAVMGLLAGYFVAGILVTTFQTLPWHENFLFFDAKYDAADSSLRRLLPPDRMWQGMLRRGGAYALSNRRDPRADDPAFEERLGDRNVRDYATFDKFGSFTARYARYRRYNDQRDPLPYQGEFDYELKP